MKTSIFIFSLLALTFNMAYAGTTEWNGIKVDFVDAYSFKNFSGQVMTANLKSGTTIYAASFSSDKSDTKVFPDKMAGITFLECHLDNVVVPPGNLVVNLYTNPPIRYKTQNDLRDWIIDDQDNPIKLIDEQYWLDKGYDIDPANIPPEPYSSTDEIPHDVPVDTTGGGGGSKPCP